MNRTQAVRAWRKSVRHRCGVCEGCRTIYGYTKWMIPIKKWDHPGDCEGGD